jgi:hypothetical protein
MKKQQYQSGKIGSIVHYISEKWGLDEKEIRANLSVNFPELKDHTHCANCGESMAIYTYSVTYLDVKLLCAMANIVNRRMNNGITFTEANKIHLQTEIDNYTLISRQTITSKLGLIAKVIKDKVHDRKAGWVITKRGYDFLHGVAVPKMVNVFHNSIQEHFNQLITMKETLSSINNKSEVSELNNIAGIFIDHFEKPRLL